MILLREARETDVDSLIHLAQIPGMFNLPADRDPLRERIEKSRRSFRDPKLPLAETKYTFVAEAVDTGKVLATSMIAGQHGTPDSPHFYFQAGSEKRFSQTINTGFIHGTLTLGHDTDGPSEIGALVVDPEMRNHASRIGRQISFVRFLYVARHLDRFRPQTIAELLPPLNKRGLSPLWEAVGRRFTNMDYWEADLLCANNKDFIFDLFPTGKIYTTFLPAEARNAIGKVGKDTEPVLHMLKKIGFGYRDQVDPFDGGPHLWATTAEILPVKQAGTYRWGEVNEGVEREGLLTRLDSDGEFRALAVTASIKDERISVKNISTAPIEKLLSISTGDEVLFMPYY